MSNSKWYFRGVKGDPVGPVSTETMYSLLAQGTLTAETEVAQANDAGNPGAWRLAVDIAAFRDRIEIRGAREAKKSETREAELRAFSRDARPTIEQPSEAYEADGPARPSVPHSWPFCFPDLAFRCLITPWMVKLIWGFTVVIGAIWIVYHSYGLVRFFFESSGYNQDETFRDVFAMQRQAFLLQHIFLIGYGVAAIIYTRVMLEIIVVFFRIGKVLGCTEGEPKSGNPTG